LKKPRVYKPAELRAAVKRAFGKPATLTEGTAETTRIEIDDWLLLHHHIDEPYFSGPPEHAGWVAVDVASQPTDAPRVAAYQRIGRLLAELGGPDVVAIFHPDSGRAQRYRPEALRLLRLNPLVDLGFEEEPATTKISHHDPEMLAAEAEARRRFPEFRARFEKHLAGEQFYVKAPFASDESHEEFMWVLVDSIRDGMVRGELANDPESVQNLRIGDVVEVPIDQVEDWNVQDESGEMVAGGFTVKVLMKREAARP